MSVTYWVISINPTVYHDLIQKISEIGAKDIEAIRKLYLQRDRKPPDDLKEEFEFFIQQDRMEVFRNQLLEELVSEKNWDLDKHFGSFKQIFQPFPQLNELHDLVDCSRFDVDIPNNCLGDATLWGIWSSKVLCEFHKVIQQFNEKEKVRTFARELQFSLLDKVFNKDNKVNQLIELWLKEDIWTTWLKLCNAVNSTQKQGWYLGFCMSP